MILPRLTNQRARPAEPVDMERGGSPVSFMIVFIIVLLIAELVVVGGRIAGAHGAVANAARVATRQGTLVQSQSQVGGIVRSVAEANLQQNGQNCLPIDVDIDAANFGPGGFVEATVSCTVSLSDLSGLGIPLPDVQVTATHKEVVEDYRAFGDVN